MTPADLSQHLENIAEQSALKLAKDAVTNVELRDAITTVRLGKNAVRIGDWDILNLDSGYSIRNKKTGEIVVSELPFYDTAMILVRHLNSGDNLFSHDVKKVIRDSGEFNRLLNDIEFYKERLKGYQKNQNVKAETTYHRLGAAKARLNFLKFELTR